MDIKNFKKKKREKTWKIKWISKMIFVTSIKKNTTKNEQKLIKNNSKRMKLWTKIHKKEFEENEIIQQKDNNENKYYLVNICI